MSEIDSLTGDYPDRFLELVSGMCEMGYNYQHFDRTDGASASAIFWNSDKIYLGASRKNPFITGESEFLMLCFFVFKENEDFKFIFGQTCLNDGPNEKKKRVI